ncbi:outer membrane beta-barrel protein [Verrucomicrobiota bacterium]
MSLFRLLVGLTAISWTLVASAQEYGRAPLRGKTSTDGPGLGRAPLPAPSYPQYSIAGSWGVRLSLGWADIRWDMGPTEGSERRFLPQASVFYMATDELDVNLSLLVASAEDDDFMLGSTEAEITRIGVGARYWAKQVRIARISPYFGGGLGYFLLDADVDRVPDDRGDAGGRREPDEGAEFVPASVSVDDSLGLYLLGGVAFLLADDFYINLDLTYDLLLGDADAEINGESEDFSSEVLSFNVGITWTY